MVLVMSLMILSLIMVSVLAVSKIIIGDVRMSVNTVNVVGSFYAAESGLESSLYYIKYGRNESDMSIFESLQDEESSPNNPLTQIVGTTGQGYIVRTSSLSSQNFVAYDISTSSPAHVDILDPSGMIGSIDWDNSVNNSHNYSVSWSITDCFPNHASDRLEINIASFAEKFSEPQLDKKVVLCNCQYDSGDTCSETIANYPISDTRYYRFSFRPLDNMVASLDFSIYGCISPAQCETLGIPSRVEAVVDGIYKQSSYRLKAEMPALGSVSDIFNYIIFTEEGLIKNL